MLGGGRSNRLSATHFMKVDGWNLSAKTLPGGLVGFGSSFHGEQLIKAVLESRDIRHVDPAFVPELRPPLAVTFPVG